MLRTYILPHHARLTHGKYLFSFGSRLVDEDSKGIFVKGAQWLERLSSPIRKSTVDFDRTTLLFGDAYPLRAKMKRRTQLVLVLACRLKTTTAQNVLANEPTNPTPR